MDVMEVLMNLSHRLSNFVFSLRLWDVMDILVLTCLIYYLLTRVRKTQFSRLLQGIVLIVVALLVSSAGRMQALNYLLGLVVQWGVLALIILFQPEIRRLLGDLSTRLSFLQIFSKPQVDKQTIEEAISQTVGACEDMSKSRTGALIVFERHDRLDEQLRSGTKLDAEVSSELLKNIFFVKAPMHDGAVLVRDGRVLGAGCMLPLSRNVNLSRDLGMRHRAGIGMSENSDAVVVIVSEETGSISCVVGGMLKRHLQADTLLQLLRRELLPQSEESEDNEKKRKSLTGWLTKDRKDGENKDE